MEYLTEEEQVERLRRWWKEYGLSTLAGIVIAIVIVVAARYYKSYSAGQAQQASLIYTTMINSSMDNQPDSAISAAKALQQNFKHSAYAGMATLWMAKNAVENNQLDQASLNLQWVIDNTKMKALKQVARLRLAQIDVQQQEPNKALALLQVTDDPSYVGMVDEIKGDAYLQQNQVAQAEQAYQSAYNALPDPDKTRPLLAMKIASLPISEKS